MIRSFTQLAYCVSNIYHCKNRLVQSIDILLQTVPNKLLKKTTVFIQVHSHLHWKRDHYI